jgi:putative acetyltransferase
VTVASLVIRAEQSADVDAVEAILREAFADHPHSQQTEHLIVHRLRKGGELVLPQIAVLAGVTVGYATFSAVGLSPAHDGWYGLGPVAVAPDFQGLRIGSALIDDGLKALKAMGAAGCVVLGEPRFYRRFGFEQGHGVTFDGAPPEYFMAHAFRGAVPTAAVSYHPAFSAVA